MDVLELGGNIELVGFKDVDRGSMIIVKKLVGNHVRKMNELTSNFERLTLTIKPIHGGGKFEVHARLLDNGKQLVSEATDFNLFFTLDRALTKLGNGLK